MFSCALLVFNDDIYICVCVRVFPEACTLLSSVRPIAGVLCAERIWGVNKTWTASWDTCPPPLSADEWSG